MAFCRYCGKTLEDGQTCDCQASAPVETAAPVAPAAPVESAPSFEQKVGDTAAVVTAQATEAATNIFASVMDIIKNPVEGVKKFIDTATWVRSIILAVLQIVVCIIFRVVGYIKSNIEWAKNLKKWARDYDMSVSKYCKRFDVDEVQYSFGDIIKSEIKYVVLYIAIFFAIAALVLLFTKLIAKKEVSFEKAFAISTITSLAVIPCTFINGVLGFIPDFKLLTWIKSAISSFAAVAKFSLMLLGLEAVIKDMKKSIYTIVLVFVAADFVDSFISFLLYSLLNF